MRGRRRSQSSIKTSAPVCASMTAVLTAVVVLPSDGWLDGTGMVFGGGAAGGGGGGGRRGGAGPGPACAPSPPLPSGGCLDVARMVFGGCPADESRSDVRRWRYASATGERFS